MEVTDLRTWKPQIIEYSGNRGYSGYGQDDILRWDRNRFKDNTRKESVGNWLFLSQLPRASVSKVLSTAGIGTTSADVGQVPKW